MGAELLPALVAQGEVGIATDLCLELGCGLPAAVASPHTAFINHGPSHTWSRIGAVTMCRTSTGSTFNTSISLCKLVLASSRVVYRFGARMVGSCTGRRSFMFGTMRSISCASSRMQVLR